MAQLVTVFFNRLKWSQDVRTRILTASKDPGRQVWLTGNVRIRGGNNAGDHIKRRQLSVSDLEALRSSSTTIMVIPPFTQDVDVENAQQISIRFKVEISGGPNVEQVGVTITEPLPPPFHQTTSTPSARAYELSWQAHNPLVTRRKRTTGPYPAARNLTTTVASPNAPNCWQYNPEYNYTLVVDKTEYNAPVLYDFINWEGWNTAENNNPGPRFTSVYHQPKRQGVRTVCRSLSDLKTIILHETAGWRMDNKLLMTEGWCNSNIAAQFNVTSDGSIFQYYDAVQRTMHLGRSRNNDGVGIEFSNIVWTNLAPNQRYIPPRVASDRSPRLVIQWWAGARFVVPPVMQLEALHALVERLLSILPEVPANYRALDAHGEPHQVGDNRRLFLMNRWTRVYDAANLPGLYSHFNVRSHTDGSFQALYLWLRTQANVSRYNGKHVSQKAYNASIDLTTNHMVRHRCSDGRRRYFVDVTSVYV